MAYNQYNPYMTYMPPAYQQNMNNDRLAYLQQYQQQIPQMPQQVPQDQMQPVAQTQQPSQVFNQGILWVQGEAGAKSYLVAPGARVLLLDSEGSKFYIKSVDQMGMPTMHTYEYKEVFPNQMPPVVAEVKEPEYATHEDVEYLKNQIEELKQKLEVKHEPIVQPTRRRPKPDDESGTDAND